MKESFKLKRVPHTNTVLVSVSDEDGVQRRAKLDRTQLSEFEAYQQWAADTAEFDKAVDKFVSPLTKAVEKIEAAQAERVEASKRPVWELEPGVDGVKPVAAKVIVPTDESLILQALEAKEFDRVTWFGDELVWLG